MTRQPSDARNRAQDRDTFFPPAPDQKAPTLVFDDAESELKSRQVAALFAATPSAMMFSLVGTILTFLMLYQTGDAARGVIWLAFAAGVVLYRVVLYWQYQDHHRTDDVTISRRATDPNQWEKLALLGNIMAGIQFGLLGTWLYEAAPTYRALFSIIVIMGYVGGALVPYASVRFAHAALTIPATFPPTIYLFFIREDGNLLAGLIALFMCGAIIYLGEVQYRIVRARLVSEMENEQYRRAAEDENITLGHNLQNLEHRAEVVNRAKYESRRRVATLEKHIENTLLPVLECDHFGRIIEWNRAAEVTFGYRHIDLAAITIHDLMTTVDAAIEWKTFYQGVLSRRRPDAISVSMRAHDGRHHLVRLNLTPIDIDNKPDVQATRVAIIVTEIPVELSSQRMASTSAP